MESEGKSCESKAILTRPFWHCYFTKQFGKFWKNMDLDNMKDFSRERAMLYDTNSRRKTFQ